jgi:hypothetical protein
MVFEGGGELNGEHGLTDRPLPFYEGDERPSQLRGRHRVTGYARRFGKPPSSAPVSHRLRQIDVFIASQPRACRGGDRTGSKSLATSVNLAGRKFLLSSKALSC